ncbi:MAG: hypothetical protein EOP47_08425 [Sphingobacteriaceae bacterium]|nr:MAG: hypothetical protein EOP47_08425 [Sphingobacteriaceae bacterium]
MTLSNKLQTKLAFIIAALSIAFNATAQKLPNLQTAGLRIPANIKMDGKTAEWNNQFQAYNAATNLYYTIANNAEFVYFTAHIKDPAVIERMTYNGFTFEVYKNDNQQIKDLVSITFPNSRNKYFSLNFSKPTGDDTPLEKNILKSNNELLQKFHKLMIVKGIKGLDTVAVYNDAGIAFAEAFDSNEDYTMELQLPIKFLPGDNSKFSYRLVINGMPPSGPFRGLMTFSANGSTTFTAPEHITPEQQAGIDELNARLAKKNAPTDFRAEYTLVKE